MRRKTKTLLKTIVNRFDHMSILKRELYLLHCETVLILKAKRDIKPFNVIYAIPPDYEDQVPVLFKIRKDTSAKIINHHIEDDKYPPNKIVIFTIKPLQKDEKITIHFDYFVFIRNNKYADLPRYVKLPNKEDLSENVRIWLASTEAVQSDNILIKLKARLLRGFSNNLMWILKKIIYYAPFHRLFLQQIRMSFEKNSVLRSLFLPSRYWTGLCDAVSYLFFGGHCTGQANFAAALLRANGIPTKILIVTEFGLVFCTKEKFWLDSQHYMIESYCPGYGWIKSTPGRVGHQAKNYIISRVLYPEDENIAGNGLSYYGGMEPWFWITNENVSIVFPEDLISFYKKPRGNVSGVPAHRLWTENKITVENNAIIEKMFSLTQNIWTLYVKCTGIYLDKSDKEKFYDAIKAQENAIKYFNQSDLKKCMEYLNIAYKTYKEIEVT